jgi:hypothetical protein
MKALKIAWKSTIVVAVFLFAAAPACLADMQTVGWSPVSLTVSPGQAASAELVYDVAGGSGKAAGLGIRLHYNSKVVDGLVLKELFGEGLIGVDTAPRDDTANFDRDPSTDKYIGIAWIGIAGDWPSLQGLPLKLGQVEIRAKANGTGASTTINVTYSSKPAGYDFQGQSLSIVVP